MNRTKIEWVKNPDGTQGYTWNPITGCLNGCSYCYARKLANGRLKQRYLANQNVSWRDKPFDLEPMHNPFHPRFWESKLDEMRTVRRWAGTYYQRKARGIFVCDMSDLFGIGIPEEWTWRILKVIESRASSRFYLLTKQPQNLIKFSPFPKNCWVGVTATTDDMLSSAILYLNNIDATKQFISFEPLLEPMKDLSFTLKYGNLCDWVIIGAQTKPYKPPQIEWVREIVGACDKAGIPVFLKENLRQLFAKENNVHPNMVGLRQELPEGR